MTGSLQTGQILVAEQFSYFLGQETTGQNLWLDFTFDRFESAQWNNVLVTARVDATDSSVENLLYSCACATGMTTRCWVSSCPCPQQTTIKVLGTGTHNLYFYVTGNMRLAL